MNSVLHPPSLTQHPSLSLSLPVYNDNNISIVRPPLFDHTCTHRPGTSASSRLMGAGLISVGDGEFGGCVGDANKAADGGDLPEVGHKLQTGMTSTILHLKGGRGGGVLGKEWGFWAGIGAGTAERGREGGGGVKARNVLLLEGYVLCVSGWNIHGCCCRG